MSWTKIKDGLFVGDHASAQVGRSKRLVCAPHFETIRVLRSVKPLTLTRAKGTHQARERRGCPPSDPGTHHATIATCFFTP